ncbi:MAG: hypothetical protein WCH01_00430 [Methylococcaceae bacterium]
MTVRYITVTPITKLFKPATRAFGDIAIVGAAQNDDIKLTTTDVTALTQGVSDVDILKKKLRSTYPDSENVEVYFTANSITDIAGFNTKGAAAGTAFISSRKAQGPKKNPIPITNPDTLSQNVKTTLSTDINTTATTVSVASVVGFPTAPFNVRIDKEIMLVTATAGTNFTVIRTANETLAEHKSGALVVFPSADKQVEDADWLKGDLGKAVRKAFEQTPGPP